MTKRDIAWLLRFKQYLYATVKNEATSNMTLSLTVEEMNEAEIQIARYIQQRYFPEKFQHLNDKGLVDNCSVRLGQHLVKKSSSLYRLEPVKLKDDVLRVGGRLRSHPIILPKNHHVTRLIIRHSQVLSRYVLVTLATRIPLNVTVKTTMASVVEECEH